MYQPGESYQGYKLLYDAIGGLGADVADAVKERKKNEQIDANNDALVEHAWKNNLGPFSDLPADEQQREFDKYKGLSRSAKTGYAAGIAAEITMDLQQKRLTQEAQQHELDRQMHLKIAQMQNEPDPNEGQPYYEPTSGDAIGVHSGGRVEFFPPRTGAPPPGSPAYDQSGKQIGVWNGNGTITKTGAEKPVDPMKKALADLITEDNAKSGQPTPTPGGGMFSWLQPPSPSATPVPPAQPSKTPSPDTTTKPPVVTTQEEFDALPSGAIFVAPDGLTHRKP